MPFQADLTAVALMCVSLAMKEIVTDRVKRCFTEPYVQACENLVKEWLTSKHKCENDAPSHTLVATVRDGLRCDWRRRRNSENISWETPTAQELEW